MISFEQATVRFILLMVCGFFLKQVGRLDQSQGRVMSALILNVTLPAAGFKGLQGVTLEPKDALLAFLGILASVFMVPFAWLACRHIQDPPLRRLLLCHYIGFSVGQFGLPLIVGAHGQEGLEYGLLFDSGNAITVFCLIYAYLFVMGGNVHESQEQSLFFSFNEVSGGQLVRESFCEVRDAGIRADPVSKRVVAMAVGRKMLGSMPLWGYGLGLIFAGAGIGIPPILEPVFDSLSDANNVLVSVMLGVFITFTTDMARIRLVALVTVVRLFVFGLFILMVNFCLSAYGYSTAYRGTLIQCLLLPPAMAMLPFAVEFGMDAELCTLILSGNCIVSVVLLMVVSQLG